jgi:MATE family multidrug resistance protein
MPRLIQVDKNTLTELVVLAIPMVISQGAFAAMVFTDRYFMAMISPTHMAASLGGGVTLFFCLSLFIGVISYGNALTAQYYGAGERPKCSRVLTQSLLLSITCAPLLLLLGHFASDIFAAAGHDPLQEALERSYFDLLIAGSVFMLLKTGIASYFSGIGRTKVVMIADTVGVALNIPLSYMLIFGELGAPALGIEGAAIGTIVSNIVTLALYIGFYFQREHRNTFSVAQSFVVDYGILKRYLRLGFPSGLEMFLNVSAFNLFLLMFQSYGVSAGASAAIVFNWDILCFVPMMGLNISVISLVGRYVGAGDQHRINGVISSGFLLALGYSGVLAIVFITFRVPLSEMFIPEGGNFDEIRQLTSFMMVGLASYVMADATILVAGGVLRGAGDTRWLMQTSILLHWAMVAAQYVVIHTLELGPRASWLIFVAMLLVIAFVYALRLSGQQWRKEEVLRGVLAEA